MADFVSFPEFFDRTSDARFEHVRDAIEAGIAQGRRNDRRLELAGGQVEPEVNRPDPRAEFDKMKAFVLERYRDVTAAHSFMDAGGNFVDCIPFESQATVRMSRAAGSKILTEAPPASPPEGDDGAAAQGFGAEARVIDPPLGQGGVDVFGHELTCPEGTVPQRRVTLAQFARLGTFDRFFRKRHGRSLPAAGAPMAPVPAASPDSFFHQHAYAATAPASYVGCTSYLNLWAQDPSPGTMNLSQHWLIGPVAGSDYPHTIEGGWQVSPTVYGTAHPVLFVYYNPDGYGTQSAPGQSRSGYGMNQFHQGFIAFPNATWVTFSALTNNGPAASFRGISTPGGPQLGFYMQWQRNADGYWILYCGSSKANLQGVGYFPPDCYAGTAIASSAANVEFGGEVAGLSGQQGMIPMGSGLVPTNPATDGFGRVAFQKEVSVLTTVGSAMTSASLTPQQPDLPSYRCLVGTSPNPNWGSYLFYGGSRTS
jgi:hypothetical protein